jgi:hypothetical protein
MQRQMSFFGILPFHLFLYMFYIIVQASNALLTLQEGNTVQSAKNKNLVYDHPMNISAKFDSNLFCGFRKKDENVKFP